jgi:ATP-dependent Lhr-like helicase
MSAVFPLQTACFEHRPPEVPIPDHPLIAQTVYDCLHEAMDVDAWLSTLKEIEAGTIQLTAKDTREPSPFSHGILNANPYSFLDDAPLEERRARAVSVRRTLSHEDMRNLARLDAEAIERVVAEAQPMVRDPEELHDTLLTLNALPAKDATLWYYFFNELVAQGRAAEVRRPDQPILLIAVERWPLIQAAMPDAQAHPAIQLPQELQKTVEAEEAIAALVRGRLEIIGPMTAQRIATELGLKLSSTEIALARLEMEGAVLQGRYTTASYKEGAALEWCERRLLARVHRLTLETARRKIQPVPAETYWQYLAEYHHVLSNSHREGLLGLREALGQLEGFEMPAGAWEMDILASRVEKYQSDWLDQLSFSGEVTWGRLRPPQAPEEGESRGSGLTRVVPITLAFRDDLAWLLPPERGESHQAHARQEAQSVYNVLKQHGALFLQELIQLSGFIPTRLEAALSELAALGLVTADGFAALRALAPVRRWDHRIRRHAAAAGRGSTYTRGGRWTLFPGRVAEKTREERLSQWAILLLRRYGLVFRDVLTRETVAPAWWELIPIYRRMEARGEIRGGRFISGVAGEQYALPEAVEALRRPRESENTWVIISAADPLNLNGIVLPGDRIPAVRGNRLLYHNGRLAATLHSGEVHILEKVDMETQDKITRALRLTQLPQLREELLKELSIQVKH